MRMKGLIAAAAIAFPLLFAVPAAADNWKGEPGSGACFFFSIGR